MRSVRDCTGLRPGRALLALAHLTSWAAAAVFAAPVLALTELSAQPDVLTAALQDYRVILLGEVHDNAEQHALRIETLRRLVAAGGRPAIAFEQFDRERQADITRARLERPRDAAHLLEQAGGAQSWRWDLYRPFVQLALDFDLPIVAANLSRADAMRLSTEGWSAISSLSAIQVQSVERMPPQFREAHQREIQRGHCDLLPAAALPAMARAQIARDVVLAQSIRPFVERGVVLLTGNGHARKDIGVPVWLDAEELKSAVSVGMIEKSDDRADEELNLQFDLVVVTPAAVRADPCVELRRRLVPGAGR